MPLKRQNGFSLLEVVIAIALFMILATGAVAVFVSGVQASKQGIEYVAAAGLIQEATEAVRSIRARDFALITAGTHGLDTGSGFYDFSGTSNTIGDFTRTITIEDVERNGSNEIVDSGGTDDPNTKRVIINITWNTLADKLQSIDAEFFIHNFVAETAWVQDLVADFTAGFFHGSAEAAAGDGEVELRTTYADWSQMVIRDELDLDGSGVRVASALDAAQDILYTLSENTSGDELIAHDVSDTGSGAPAELRALDIGYTGTGMAIAGDYLYLSTTDNANEILVVHAYSMTQVNVIDVPGSADANDVAVDGDVLIVVKDDSGSEGEVFVYDITDPLGTITQIGSVELGADGRAVAAGGGYAYVGTDDSSDEMVVVRLSDAANVNTENLSGGERVNDVLLVDDRLYVVRNDDGSDADVLLLDVSTPEGSISVDDSLDAGDDVNGIAVDRLETFAFVATDDDGAEVMVVDLASFAVTQTADVNGASDARSIQQFGGYLYVTTEDTSNDLAVLEPSSGGWSVPELVASVNKTSSHIGLSTYVSGNYAYLGTASSSSQDELFIYDISTPTSPTYLGSFNVGANVNDIVVSGDYAYLATSDNSRELDVIDVSTPSSPSRAGSYNANGNIDAFAVDISGTTIYLGRDSNSGASNDEFVVVNVSTPASPTLIGSLNYNNDINDVVVSGSYVYAANDSNSQELLVISVATPSSPSSVGSLDVSGSDNGEGLAVSGSTVVLVTDSASGDEMHVIDVTTPASPTLLGGGEIGDNAWSVVIDGTDVFVVGDNDDDEFQVWDISTPSSPSQVATYDLDGDGRDVFTNGTHVYVATENAGAELQLFGPTEAGSDYPLDGTFTSQAYDAGSGVSWSAISWSVSGTGTVEFRVRTASTQSGLATARWVGSDGTPDTSYSVSETSVVTDASATGTQWIQWKAYLYGDGSATPTLEDVTLTYVE